MVNPYIANSEKVFQIDIEKYLGLRNPSVTSLIKNLVSNDYVYRIKDDFANAIYNTNQMIDNTLSKEEHDMLTSLLTTVNELIVGELNEDK